MRNKIYVAGIPFGARQVPFIKNVERISLPRCTGSQLIGNDVQLQGLHTYA